MTLNELTSRQQQTGEEIRRIIVNYKKDSPSRKNEAYLIDRLKSLDSLWEDFDGVDSNIRLQCESGADHPYFTKGYYETIKAAYDDIRQDIINKLEALHAMTGNGISTVQEGEKQGKVTADITAPTMVDEQLSRESAAGALPTTIPAQNTSFNNTLKLIIQKQRLLINTLKRALSGLPTDNQPRSEQYCKLNIKTIERHWSAAEQLHHKIWEQTDDPASAGYDAEEYFNVEEQTKSNLIRLHERLHIQTNAASPSQNSIMKLPKIVLPKFDGDYLKWREFCDLFTEVVHNQPMAACQKMWYLKTSLSGDAEKLVRHLTMSDTNYVAAWKIIKERYENTRLLVTAFLNKLLSQPAHGYENASAIKSLHDTTQECLLALENMGIKTTHWDPLLMHILMKKLDRTTHGLYEQSLSQPRKLQPIKDFLSFLETRFQSLEALGNKGKTWDEHQKKFNISRSLATTSTAAFSCSSCKGDHQLFFCPKFLQLTPSSRLNFVKRANLCINCLRSGHNSTTCPSRGCKKCSKGHNTLLHLESTSKQAVTTSQAHKGTQPLTRYQTPSPSSNQTTDQSLSLTARTIQAPRGYVLLSTVMVTLINNNGVRVDCRAILDSGSQLNLITERMVKRLGVTEIPELRYIQGIGQRKQQTQRRVNILLGSRINEFNTRLEAHVLPRIISPQPAQAIDTTSWPIPQNIKLADPRFNRPDSVDLLIGAEIYYSILSVGQIKLGNTLPTLQNTVFGWAVAGRVHGTPQTQTTCGICSADDALGQQIEKFWRLEETEGSNNNFTIAERRCETYFNHTTKRNSSGRFIVSLPFRDNPSKLGESKDIARQRFASLERKLAKNRELKIQYVEFMEEYVRLGHMQEIKFHKIQKPYYFLPHHCVIKPESSTTKLRVVFDASAKTSSNLSLNDMLSTGPTIQDDVFSILLRFRLPRFVFTADIEKMYRQIEVDEDDRKYQLIWWRNDPSEDLKCFQLCTVTYGTTSAPYLATKCLQRLANEQAEQYPLGSEVAKRDFYVDDVMTGSDSLITAIDMQTQLKSLLQTAGFNLRKWCANHPRLLQDIPQEDTELQLDFNSKVEEHIKTVGLTWLPKCDSFCIRTTWREGHKVTKRIAYSDVAHLFDPLGIMAPVVVTAKMFLQRLWTLKLDWDASLPQELHTTWIKFREGLKTLNDIKFPRHVYSHRVPKSVQFHIFADASEKAYGAAAYIRSTNKDSIITVRLLCAKSRVAPIKQITLPRLELCAAKLAAELGNRVKSDLKIMDAAIFFWTDSEIVLKWINASSSPPDIFVANRVSAIQQLTIPQQWRHVRSKENPADILSRGIAPERLESCNLWFYGPLFLHGAEALWPPPFISRANHEPISLTTAVIEESTNFIKTINHKNSFRTLQRVVAYMLRFIRNARQSNRHLEHSANTLALNTSELEEAQTIIIRLMQEEEFKADIAYLKRHKVIRKTSPLNTLAPFLDEGEIMRVGGRLEAAALSYDAKHPMLLPNHEFTKLLLNDIHKENFHAGPQALLSITRQRFWPMKGKTMARSIVQHCVLCARAKPKLFSQLMGNLPADRVQPARPFVNSGVDFCGPIYTHFKIRGKRPQKSYIAVFCCFATKATHLEVVSDLSTQGFLGALKRFTGRRGHCKNIYCDNATNFVGAKNQLQELKEIIQSNKSIEKIATACSKRGTDFHLIPPRAPHFGGLWEAAVKSAKHLLQSSLASASLTYEELETVIIEVEAILNSRPITPMSSDPNDITALTPGHFLIGEPLTSTVDPKAEPVKPSLLKRWELVSDLKNQFWRRWTTEYLNQLQHRYKWKHRCQNVQPGTMVIIKEDNMPALKWHLGRIVNTVEGDDGLVRVADVRTATGVLRRAIHSLSPLPVGDELDTTGQDEPEDNMPQSTSETETARTHSRFEEQPSCRHKNTGSSKKTKAGSSRSDAVPRKKTRRSIGTGLVTLLLACLITPIIKASPLELTPFKSQPGIYFENLGAANIITSEWNLIVYYDMQPYWKEFETFSNCSQMLENVCELIDENNSCLRIVNHFRHLRGELSKNNELLLPTANASRIRRGAVNFIGNVANALFGVLDSEYAEKMSQTIENIQHNEDHLLSLIKNQTSFLDATVNIMKQDQEAISSQFHELESHLDQVTNKMNDITEELYQERLAQLFTSLAVQGILIASNFQRVQSYIRYVIVDTHHGRLSPQLIAPAQLKQELITIKGHLPSSLRLPVSQDDIPKLYNLIVIEGRPTTRYVIFKLKLPLLALEDFELFRIIPVPVLVNSTFVAIRPSSPFLVINLHRDQYYPLTEQELRSCMSVSEDKHMCRQNHPIYRKGSIISSCELDFINHLPQSPSCQIMKTDDGPHWIQLYNPNQWIYVLRERTTINVVCGDNVSQTTIEGSGILKIQNSCVIKQQLITIQGHNTYPTISRMSYTPASNLADFIKPEHLAPIFRHTSHYQPHLEELEAIKRQLLQVNKELPSTIHPHDVHQFAVGYIGLALTFTIIVYAFWRFRTTIWKILPAKPRPQPRTHIGQESIDTGTNQESPNADFSVSFETERC